MNSSFYADILKKKPFQWGYDDPKSFESFQFERIDPFYWHKIIDDNWKLSYYAIFLYVITIFGLREYMKNRPAFELKGPLFVWNLSLGIFSALGFARMAPGLLHIISQPNGLYNSICVKSSINVPTVYWIILFAFSKFWELGDTVFIVLRKRPLIFLQWYHHLITLWVVWTVAPLVEPISRWYCCLNFGVHALMYPYFALKIIGIRIPVTISKLITTLQLIQMVLGISVNIASLYLQKIGYDCARFPISIKAFNLVYGSFTILFGKLFYESVIKICRKKRE